ncbi:MFS transporter [Sulfitobacter sp. 20_GPM-1509m]|uniref:MFS transporter n=1 Tax=Sulfitobacter sp. 20_GPM-1509m TaxID=1380367 RepID=UPI0006843B48|nr:MFS transporter [Sulfitobacter sp. 20_GPM-1509m]
MGNIERFSLYVALTALTALAIDGVLPAMLLIETELGASPPFTIPQIITVFVFGMAFGELLIGPMSDAVGRRPAVIAGLVVFVAGTALAATGDSLGAVVAGRFLQGVGVAGPKIGTRAMIRDRYAGADMAQVMSVIFTLLILVPMIAPAIGAQIAAASGWRGVFWGYFGLTFGLGAWLWLRHPETLPAEKRIPFQYKRLRANTLAVLRRKDVTPIVIATGFVFGAQLTYFAVAADLFGTVYGLPASMPLFFALLATGTGTALLLNVRFVRRTGMEAPIVAGLGFLGLSGAAILGAAALTGGHPPFALLLGLAWFGFFALGLLFGNLNAFAMRPLGDLAGLSSSIIASLSSVVAFVFATAIERAAEGPVYAIAFAFLCAALLSALLILIAVPKGSIGRFLSARTER